MATFRDLFLVTVDCLRPDYVGAYNPQRPLTPNIDSLTQRAAVFTQAVTHAPFTTPAIASLLSGMYPFQTGVRLLLGQLCNRNLQTLAEFAQRAGFLTAGFPSAFVINSDTGLARGFSHYRDINDGIASGRGGCWQTGERINQAVDELLTVAGRQRVFCWIHYFDLHDYHLDQSVSVEVSYPRDVTEKIDRQCIGGLFDILRRHGRFDDAAFILTADHGECLYQHGHRGHGQHLYDSVLRVPLIWRWPGLTDLAGQVSQQTRLVDLMPTILQLWGFPREDWPGRLDGRSIVPLLRGRSLTKDAADTASFDCSVSYAEASPRQLFEGDIKATKPFAGPEQQALRTGQHKFILHEDGRRELYDLQKDPYELTNIADRCHAVADDLDRKLATLVGNQAGMFSQVRYREDQEEKVISRLRELGYVS